MLVKHALRRFEKDFPSWENQDRCVKWGPFCSRNRSHVEQSFAGAWFRHWHVTALPCPSHHITVLVHLPFEPHTLSDCVVYNPASIKTSFRTLDITISTPSALLLERPVRVSPFTGF